MPDTAKIRTELRAWAHGRSQEAYWHARTLMIQLWLLRWRDCKLLRGAVARNVARMRAFERV